jgi:hypothetical protein
MINLPFVRNVSFMVVVIMAALVPSAARANWLARCQTDDGLCYAEACGTSPQDASNKCSDKCPGADLLSLGTSNCVATFSKVLHPKTPRPKVETFQIK